MASDSLGNTVVVGYFKNTVDFGTGPISSVGGADGFIVKYNSQGTALWTKGFGGMSDDFAKAVAMDSAGNIIVVGQFAGTVDFGGQILTTTGTSSDPYAGDIFVAKYSSANPPSLLWVKQFGGIYGDGARAVAVDTRIDPNTGRARDNIFVSADISSAVTFGAFNLSTAGTALVELSGANGSVVWAQSYGITAGDIAVDKFGDLLLAGSVWNPAIANYNIFLAKYSGTDGHNLWSKTVTSSSPATQIASGVAADPNTGNMIFTGQYAGAADFGGPITDFFGTANGVGGIFLAVYDASGNYLWAKTPNMATYGFSDESGNAVSADATGNIYVTGKVNSAVYFTGSQILLGGHAMFSASFAGNGSCRWAKRSGGAGGNGTGIAVDPAGHVFITGEVLNGTMYFDGSLGAAGGSVSTASGTTAPFVVQFSK